MAATDLPLGVIIIWAGTNAGIPAGFVRETALDGLFPKATALNVDPNVSGGSDTHTHTSPAHTHNAQAHRHYGQTNSIGSSIGEDTGSSGSNDASHDDHYHNFDFTNVSGGNLSDAITYLAGDSKPPYYEVIFIKPDTVPAGPPSLSIALFDRSTLPTNWNVCDGLNSTPNLHDKYLRGASAAGDSGSMGGSLNHTHAIDHTHSSVNHSHVGLTQNDGNADRWRSSSGGGGAVVPRHQHGMSLDAVGETGDAYTGNAGAADTVEPRYRKLMAIQNNTGGVDKPQYMIGLWLGTLATIPAGWSLCDGGNGTVDMRGYHLKLTKNSVEIGNVGGSNTHTHAPSNSHTHNAAGSHTHTGSSDSYVAGGSTGAGGPLGAKTHSHSMTSVSAATSSWDNALVQADSSNGEPQFLTVAFIQFTGVKTQDLRSAEVAGQLSGASENLAEITGINPGEQRGAEIHGYGTLTSERGCEISAMIEWVIDDKPDMDDFTA